MRLACALLHLLESMEYDRMEREREMIGLSYRSSTREGRACRGRTPSASVLPSDATSASLPFRTPPSLVQHNEIRRNVAEMCASQFLKSSVPLCLRALRVNRPEARGRLPAPRAEAARVHRVPSGRLTRSARSHGDTEIGFKVGLRAASPIEEGRECTG